MVHKWPAALKARVQLESYIALWVHTIHHPSTDPLPGKPNQSVSASINTSPVMWRQTMECVPGNLPIPAKAKNRWLRWVNQYHADTVLPTSCISIPNRLWFTIPRPKYKIEVEYSWRVFNIWLRRDVCYGSCTRTYKYCRIYENNKVFIRMKRCNHI